MLTLLSPSKNLDFKTPLPTKKKSEPMFLDRASELIDLLRQLQVSDLTNLMGISEELGQLNVERYQQWTKDLKRARPAILTFKGEVYIGLSANDFDERDYTSAQRRIRILSGLYGLLRPLDLIHPYRLEMGSNFPNSRGEDLYDYWCESIASELNKTLADHKNPVILNAASNEYFSPRLRRLINYRIVDCKLLDRHKDDYRFMTYFGKRARGVLARYVIQNRINSVGALKRFNEDGYYYSKERSTRDSYVFLRDNRPG